MYTIFDDTNMLCDDDTFFFPIVTHFLFDFSSDDLLSQNNTDLCTKICCHVCRFSLSCIYISLVLLLLLLHYLYVICIYL